MKKIILTLLFLHLASVAMAAQGQGYPPANPYLAQQQNTPDPIMPLPDYLSQDTVSLSKTEQQALRLSRQWSGRGPAPVLSFGGKLIYVHGASLPTILASPMQVCDIELEPGEKVNEIVVGDSARWLVDSGSVGAGSGETVHLFVKPVDAGLETTAVVTTNRRVYHLRLISQRSGHTPYVGFTYSDKLKVAFQEKQAAQSRAEHWRSADIDGQRLDLSKLDFDYKITGKASWKPVRVYNDGQQTYIRLPDKTSTGEMPVLLVRKGSQNVLVNYRVQGKTMVADGLFDKISLILGVGSAQEEVIIKRGK